MATISDKHVQVAAPGNTVVDYYTAEVLTATDYYPFGMLMPQRQFYIDTTTYIVGTTSTEAATVIDTTVVQLYKHSFSDTPSVHPYVTVPTNLNSNLSGSTWTNSRNVWTNYASNTNMGKAIAFDNSTSDTSTVTLTLNIASGKKVGIKSFSFYNRVSNSGYRHWKMYINGIEVGDSLLYYPATGGTGNNTVKTTGTVPVKNAVEDLTGTITVLLKLYDHDAAYPNGNAQGTFRMDDFVLNGYVNDDGSSTANGYQYANKGGYRYGFNGQEKSDEIKGEGNSYTAEFWEYDPRIGRRWNVDPKPTNGTSPYITFMNNPINRTDILGDTVSTTIDGVDYSYYQKDKKWNLYDNKGNAYSGKSKWAKNLVNSLNELGNISDDKIRERFNDVITSSYRHNIIESKPNENAWVKHDGKRGDVYWDGITTFTSGAGISRLNYATEKLTHELLGHGWQGQNGFTDFNNLDLSRQPVAFYNQDNKTITKLLTSPIVGLSYMEVDATSIQNRYLGYYSLKSVEYYPLALVRANPKTTELNIIKLIQKPEVKALYFLFPAGNNEFLNLEKK